MLVCGCVNPPPETDPEYRGVYFHEADDMQAKAKAMSGTPLRVEHVPEGQIGTVVSAWLATDGSLYALAEIDTATAGGAVAASYIKTGRYKGFSLGYSTIVKRDTKDHNRIFVGEKRINELSVCREGARPGCTIKRWHKSASNKRV